MNSISLRVLSYNIHKGFSSYNRRFVLNRIRDAVHFIHADLVFLQEVIGHHERHAENIQQWPKNSQFEYLADSLWPHYAYGKNAIYTDGHHGNAILSKFPIRSWENIDISMNRLENRGLLHAVIQIPNQSIRLHAICLHLGLFEADRQKQILSLCHRIESIVPHHEPLIVAGDFNDWRGIASQLLQSKVGLQEAFLQLQGEHPKTFPCWLPVLRLDRIYFRGFKPVKAQCFSGAPWNGLSDHAAVFSELVLDPSP